MRHPIRMFFLPLLLTAACRSPHDTTPIRAVDLIKEFDRAERRPPAGFSVVDRGRPAILAPAPGRITWTLHLPSRGRLRTAAAIEGANAVRFRVGVSDARIYEGLQDVTVTARGAWTEMDLDLSAYAGWKWSLFYHPGAVDWRLTLSTDAVQGVPGQGLWGAPEIITDRRAAVEYQRRRR